VADFRSSAKRGGYFSRCWVWDELLAVVVYDFYFL
jgi:hypothetical protein